MITAFRMLQPVGLALRCLGMLAVGLLLPVVASSSEQAEELRQVLDARGVSLDPDMADRTIFDALLKLVDPHAKLLGTNSLPANVAIETAPGIEEWPEGILYVQLSYLCETNTGIIIERLREWSPDSAAGIIADLRGAGGEDTQEAVQLAGVFVDDGTPLYEVRNGKGEVLETVHASRDTDMSAMPPLMILIDGETHAASEALAAVLAGHPGVMVIGTPSRGDAGLREIVMLSETQRLYIATRWIVPSVGDSFDREGVRPHIRIERDGPRDANPPVPFKDGVAQDLIERIMNDSALSRATDVLLGLKALRKP